MGVHSLFARLQVVGWWLCRPRSLWFRALRAAREKRASLAYRKWLATGTALTDRKAPGGGVRLTVAMAVFRVPEGMLREAIASVQRQSFTDFEFLILDDASPDPHVRRVLREATSSDTRIRLLENETRAGIAEAANRLTREARGDWVVFVDHDDTLSPHALEEIANAIESAPDVDWFFSDEDKLDREGAPDRPCFKLGFSSHLALSWNYMAHLRAVRRDRILAVGAHRRELEGAQDWDLALRFLASGGRFSHIPRVLYHWRKAPGSMALGSHAKAFANRAAEAAIRHALLTLLPGCPVDVRPLVPGASQFAASWRAPLELGVTLLTCQDLPGMSWPRPHQVFTVQNFADPEAVEACLRKAQHPVVAVLPPRGLPPSALERLLARLLLPGTLGVGGRCLKRRKIRGSGFLVSPSQQWRDPLAGLPVADPGYCNLGWLPQPRAVLLPWGFVAWREALEQGWRLAAEVPSPWRLTVGLARVGQECVTIPDVAFDGPPPPPPDPLPKLGPSPYPWRPEFELFDLFP